MTYRDIRGWLVAVALIGGVVWPSPAAAQACGGTCAQIPKAQGAIISGWPLDSSGKDIVGSNTGVVIGGAFQAGEVCSAFNSLGVANRIRVAPAPTLNVTTFTVEGWVRLDPPLNQFNPIMVWKGASAANVSTSFGLGVLGTSAGPNARTMWGLISDGVTWQFIPAAKLSFGAFTHVALTADGAQFCLYVNGAPTCIPQTLTPRTTTSDLVIGALNNNQNWWNGLIDEVTLYNRALDQTEIQAIKTAGTAGKCRCTEVAHYFQQKLAAANATIAAQQAEIGSLQSRLDALHGPPGARGAALPADVATPDRPD